MIKVFLLYGVLTITLCTLDLVKGEEEELNKVHFTNSWAVHIENGDHKIADEIAEKHGFINYGQIGSLPGYFHFVRTKKESRRHRREVEKTSTLLSEEKIKWVEQQQVLERDKRSVVPEYVSVVHPTGYSVQDPLYNDQWYLNNVGQSSGPSSLDINVLPVWSRGISGKNVVVAILDDGLDHTHPDLRKNYDPTASYDFNDYDEDPMPRDSDPNNCHGTKCAGEVAAEAGNGVCGVGVAFNCSIAGIRMLDGNVTDTIEGGALSYKKDYIDIYSCAWGPKDDGKRFGRPGTLASKALEFGVKDGRNGLGSIFIWATGNGGLTDDDCNCDGYTTSVYTVSIGAISDHGLSTYYTESCASTLAVTYSGGSHREKKENKIITTTLNHKCSSEFKGTSSAAPLAAGMVALMLEANVNLTWRDVQHIIVETSLMTSPLDEGWRRNGAGKWFNQKFGFGRMDASAMVDKAQSWANVNRQKECWSDTAAGPWNIPSSGTTAVSMNSSACADTGSAVKSLEHVQVVLTMRHRHRGHVSIELISPSGTRTRLLKTRRNDKSTKGLKDWIFMSVHFWGEDPRGLWTLAVTDNSNNNRQHHRIKSRYGDLEDATQILQDDIDGKSSPIEEESSGGDKSGKTNTDDKNKSSYKTAEEFENNIFKDSSFRHKNSRRKNNRKQPEGVDLKLDTENEKVHSTKADNVLKKLKEQRILSKLREKGAKINTERLKEKLRKHRLKSAAKRKKARKYNSNDNDNDNNIENETDNDNDDETVEEKLLEEILKEVQGDKNSDKTSTSTDNRKTNATTESPVEKPGSSESQSLSLLKPTASSLYAHNTTAEVIPPPHQHPSSTVNTTLADEKTNSVSSKHNTSTTESSIVDDAVSTAESTLSGSSNTNLSGDSESRILESLLRNVISQVFGNFLSEKNGVKSFEERIYALEALLGRNGSSPELDRITSSLQNAFKSGSAIDRVNNVLGVLENGKNQTKLANTSFSRNADVVINVLKVLKDVLSTEKDNKNLKGYKQRISSLLEAQTETTHRLTEKLMSDLKPSVGINDTNEGIVDDALALISQIFENRQNSSLSDGVERGLQKYRIKFDDSPDSEGIESPETDSSMFPGFESSPKVITTTRSSKEIQRDGDHIEKIVVERTNVKKNKKKTTAKKSSATRDKYRQTIRENSSAEDDEQNEEGISNSFDDNELSRSDIRQADFDGTVEERAHLKPAFKKKSDSSFTITLIKDGEKLESRSPNKAISFRQLANMFDDAKVTTPAQLTNFVKDSDFLKSDNVQKKTHATRPSDGAGNIDIEVLVDGKPEVEKSAGGTIDLSRVVDNINLNGKSDHTGVSRTDHYPSHHPSYTRRIDLRVNEDLVPKSLTHDLAKKKTLVHTAPKNNNNTNRKKRRKKTRKQTTRRNKYDTDTRADDENAFSFFQFNEPLPMSAIPIIPDGVSETLIPTFEDNSFPIAPDSGFFDSTYSNYENEKASLYDDYYSNNNFETPLFKSRIYDIDKRSRLRYPKTNNDGRKEQQRDLPELLSNLIHSRRRRSHDYLDQFDDVTSTDNTVKDSLPLSTTARTDRRHTRRRRSVEPNDDKDVGKVEPTLDRQKRNTMMEDEYMDNDYDGDINDNNGDNDDGGDDGPHVVKRSAIFSELYPSKQPLVSMIKSFKDNGDNTLGTVNADDDQSNETDENDEVSRSRIEKEVTVKKIDNELSSKKYVGLRNTTGTTETSVGDIKKNIKDNLIAKRSAIKKALSLESTLRRKLFSMRKESSSVLDIIKRVHTDIAHSNSKDLRMLERELSTLETSSSSPTSPDLSSSSRSSIEKLHSREEPLEKLIKLMEQSENSSLRDEVVGPGETSDDGKQNPDEYYRYGTAISGVLVNWTLKFHGTG